MRFLTILAILPLISLASAVPKDSTDGSDSDSDFKPSCMSSCEALATPVLKCARENGMLAPDGVSLRELDSPDDAPKTYRTCICTSPVIESNLKKCLTCFTDPEHKREFLDAFAFACDDFDDDSNSTDDSTTDDSTTTHNPTIEDSATKELSTLTTTGLSSPTTTTDSGSGDSTTSTSATSSSSPTGSSNNTQTTTTTTTSSSAPSTTGNAASAIEIVAWKMAGAVAVIGGLVAVM